jgi:acyl-CoA thioesterase-1
MYNAGMNPVVLFLASGESLYVGVLVLLAAVLATMRMKNPWLLRLRNLLALVGLAMMTFAGPPVTWWVVGLFFIVFFAWFVAWNVSGTGRRLAIARFTATAGVALLALLVTGLEWPHRAMQPLQAGPFDGLAVIGDSLSAGIETSRSGPWPREFERLTGVPVHNLAQAGAQVSDGPALAKRLAPEDRLVIVELGGNDLIAGVPAADFERGLRQTLTAIVAAPLEGATARSLVMFELPLLPHKVAYGRIQRRLAAEFGVVLIPRRHLTEVLGAADATSDGLHLAPAGARRMAELVAEKLGPVLRKPAQGPKSAP